jgi:single-strand DNA-binding protein
MEAYIMSDYNKIILLGRLTRDPEMRYTPAGTAVADFGLAINHKYKQGNDWKEEVCFLDITVFGRQAETVCQYLSKGRQAMVEGRLRYESWETNGQKRSKHKVVADRVLFLGQTADGQGTRTPQAAYHGPGEEPDEPDDVPF